MQKEKLKRLTKLDLHCHLDGSLTPESVSELLKRQVLVGELRVDDDCPNLADYLKKFELPLQCLQSYRNLKKASREFLLSLQDENIKYVEVRFAPMLSVNESLSCDKVIEAVLEGLEEAKKTCGIYYNVIVCNMRHHSTETNMSMIKTARAYLGQGVCAADLAGNEAAYPMGEFKTLFEYVRSLEMPFTIHAGECGSFDNIKEAILLGAKRIGHGIAMRGNPEVKALCKERRIGIEMCPISNMQTKAVKALSEYPLREFLNEGLAVSINTDNRTVSNTSLCKEFEFVEKNFSVNDDETILLIQNGIETVFADDDIKNKLFVALENDRRGE